MTGVMVSQKRNDRIIQPRRHYLLPASHASRHFIESANKQHTIVHAVGPVVCQSNIYLTKDSDQDIIIVEAADNNYSNEYLLSAAAELNKTYNFEAIKSEDYLIRCSEAV